MNESLLCYWITYSNVHDGSNGNIIQSANTLEWNSHNLTPKYTGPSANVIVVARKKSR